MYFNMERSDTTRLSRKSSLMFIPVGRITVNVTCFMIQVPCAGLPLVIFFKRSGNP